MTQDELKLLFDYADGKLIAKTKSNTRKIGQTFCSVTEKGYLRGSVNGKSYNVH